MKYLMIATCIFMFSCKEPVYKDGQTVCFRITNQSGVVICSSFSKYEIQYFDRIGQSHKDWFNVSELKTCE